MENVSTEDKGIFIQQTKEAMGYQNLNNNNCGNCKHSKEEDNPYEDRSWILICYFSNLCPFTTTERSICKKYQQK